MESKWTDDAEPTASRRLGVVEDEDLSQTCRRDRYCIKCMQAFCSHCCHWQHDILVGSHPVIRVGVNAAGQPIEDSIVKHIAAHDYATSTSRDAYCINCKCAFSTGICHDHHQRCGRESIVRRIEERNGRHYVRCKGDEKWFAGLEPILGDPVGEDYGELMLLPLLRKRKGTCVQCGGPVAHPLGSRCSRTCAANHDREVAQRRERRDLRRARRRIMDELILFKKQHDQAMHQQQDIPIIV